MCDRRRGKHEPGSRSLNLQSHVQAVRPPATRFITKVKGIDYVQRQLVTCQVES